jgi:hypothetical protein
VEESNKEVKKMSVTAGVILEKVAVAVASDRRVQNFILAVIVGIIAFIVIIFGTFFTIMDSLTLGNSEIISMAFSSSQSDLNMNIPVNDAEGLKISITAIQESFKKIDKAVVSANDMITPKSLDDTWVKSVFFAIFFEKEQPADDFYNNFINCFITTETINGVQTVVPLTDKNILFDKLKNDLKLPITDETIKEADEVYSKIKDGTMSQ